VETKVQPKEWCPYISGISRTKPLKLILVSVSTMKMGNKWRTNERPLHVTLLLWGTMMGSEPGDVIL